jgi:hypothetical protein
MEDQPIGEDQQALLAEFERRRRVRKKILWEIKMIDLLIRLDKFMFQQMI